MQTGAQFVVKDLMLAGARITLVHRDGHAPCSGILAALMAGSNDFDEAHLDLRPLLRFAGARFYHDEVTGIDLAGGCVFCRNRAPVRYDPLSINIGSDAMLRMDRGGARAASKAEIGASVA
jgi:NADH dehydrogenase FAD-containing subunit